MAGESAENTSPRRTIPRVSMVPIHSSYPRAPYAAQKNPARSQALRAVSLTGKVHTPADVVEDTSAQRRAMHGQPAAPHTQQVPNQPNSPAQGEPRQSQARYGRNGQRAIAQTGAPQPRPAQPMAQPGAQNPFAYVPVGQAPTAPPASAPAPARLPQGAVYAPGTSPVQQEAVNRPQPPHRTGRGTGALGSQGSKKAKYTALTIILIVFFFTSLLPRIVSAIVPAADTFNSSITEPETYLLPAPDVEEETSETTEGPIYYAKEPYAIPLNSALEIGTPLPPERPGSRETPAGVGQRIVANNVAITVLEIERGEKAARASWSKAPEGYEYVLVKLQYENPQGSTVTFDPIFLTDADTGIYPEALMEGLDFRYEVEPDENGVITGDVLFLARTDEHYTLMMHSFNGKYPIVFYALP